MWLILRMRKGHYLCVVDIIDNYVYTCNLDDKEDILVLEQKNVDGEVIFEEVEN